MRYAVVLAAGKGTRMRADRPKPLVEVCGVSMLGHVLGALAEVPELARIVVVVGHDAELVEAELARLELGGVEVITAHQATQRGTGDAVRVGLGELPELLPGVGGSGAEVLVVPADTPLLTTATFQALLAAHAEGGNAATVLTMELDDPTGYGRIVRGRNGRVERIVEQSDLDDHEVAPTREVNTGVYVFDLAVLPIALRMLAPTNRQREYYLTDSVALLAHAGYRVDTVVLADPTEALGVNDRLQLAEVEALMCERIRRRWLARGVRLAGGASVWIGARVEIAPGATVGPNVVLEGRTRIDADAVVGPGSRLRDTVVGRGAELEAVVAVEARIGEYAVLGPFCVLRPGASVEPKASVEPFGVVG